MFASTTKRAAVRVACDAAASIAKTLNLLPVPEASDATVAWYRGAGIWLRQSRAAGTSPLELRIVGDDLDAVVSATKLASDCGRLAVRMDARDAGSADGADALARAGIRTSR